MKTSTTASTLMGIARRLLLRSFLTTSTVSLPRQRMPSETNRTIDAIVPVRMPIMPESNVLLLSLLATIQILNQSRPHQRKRRTAKRSLRLIYRSRKRRLSERNIPKKVNSLLQNLKHYSSREILATKRLKATLVPGWKRSARP